MAILATLSNPDLFSILPTTPPTSNTPSPSSSPKPPIPIPKYPPPLKSHRNPKLHSSTPLNTPALKTHHRNSKYQRPIELGQKIPLYAENRSIVVGNFGITYQLPGAPFEFMHSYSEMPKAPPLVMRDPTFLPFAPPTKPRPWTGIAPRKKSKRKIKLFEPFDESDEDDDSVGGKRYEMLRDYKLGNFSVRPREEVLGEPLIRSEIKEMLKPCLSSSRQVNLGRDGVTHNMLELIHTHWRRLPVCKVRCLGVPTVDMDNICRCLEEKSGGKIIHRVGGVLYLFRGRNYDHRNRHKLPVMLWKPAKPVYSKLVQDTPEGLSKEEADELRMKGKKLLPICKLAKHGVYVSLVRDVRAGFEGSVLVKLDCKGMDDSDRKKLGAKLKELVPCVLLSFDDEQILMWRGREWKSMYENEGSDTKLSHSEVSRVGNISDGKSVKSSPKMMSLWQLAIESGKASILNALNLLSPDEVLSEVEEFDRTFQATEHSYPAIISSNKEGPKAEVENDNLAEECYEIDDDDKGGSVPVGSLHIDIIAKQLSETEDDV